MPDHAASRALPISAFAASALVRLALAGAAILLLWLAVWWAA